MEYTIKRSKRKTIAISVEKDGTVIVKAPLKRSKKYIESLVVKYSDWIEEKKAEHIKNARSGEALSEEDIKNLKKKAKEVMSQKTKYWADIMEVEPSGVKITSATTRWGSCSYRNSICYSYRTMLLSDRAQDYVVIHELSHIRHKNHSKQFYNEVSKYMPDYQSVQKEIKEFSNFDLYHK